MKIILYLLALGTISSSYAWCPTNFEQLGSLCYFIGHVQEPWEGAKGFCEGLGDFLGMPVSLAVLDVGLDVEKQNKLLLSKILETNEDYWLGGNAEEGTREFTWVDGRVMDPTYSYWYFTDPTDVGNCVSVQVTSVTVPRAYLYSTDCSTIHNVICQTTPPGLQPKPECPSPFEEVGGYCMVFSKHRGLPTMNFEEARSYCQGMDVASGHVDLAVLGLEGEQDQQVLTEILETGEITWLGGRVETGNDTMYWVDGRDVDITAYYWLRNEDPGNNGVTGAHANVYTYHGHSTIKLVRGLKTNPHHFVCQIF